MPALVTAASHFVSTRMYARCAPLWRGCSGAVDGPRCGIPLVGGVRQAVPLGALLAPPCSHLGARWWAPEQIFHDALLRWEEGFLVSGGRVGCQFYKSIQFNSTLPRQVLQYRYRDCGIVVVSVRVLASTPRQRRTQCPLLLALESWKRAGNTRAPCRHTHR